DLPTIDEGPDANGDGNPDDARDTDGNGIPDYLDPEGTITPPPPTPGGLSGGALCSASPSGAPAWPAGLLLAAVVGWAFRRRRR
ncbi:MAG: hypothetical protein H6719_33120, partial [Sandaracinaceae bacterium]|nr:hypothetical protein [Sandaracinaceae bacterium]